MSDVVERLLPCPFCGRAARLISCMGAWTPKGYEPDGRRIACSVGDCSGVGNPFYGDRMDEQATAWWNTRARLSQAGAGDADLKRFYGDAYTPPATPVQPTASVEAVREIANPIIKDIASASGGSIHNTEHARRAKRAVKRLAEEIVRLRASLTPAPTQGDGA